jgi:hypothetical protein
LALLHHRLDVLGLGLIATGAAVSLLYLCSAHALHDGLTYPHVAATAAFTGGFLPALAGCVASIRYHGDFERFAKRSLLSSRQLEHLRGRLLDLQERTAACDAACVGEQAPPFEDLCDIILSLQAVLEDDLEDWRLAYASRATPRP